MNAIDRRLLDAAINLRHPAERERYREEWTAEMTAAPSVGIPPRSVAVGALRTATVGRLTESRRLGLAPAHRGVRLLRWGVATGLIAFVVATTAFLGGIIAWNVVLATSTLLLVVAVALCWAGLRLVGRSPAWLLLVALCVGAVLSPPFLLLPFAVPAVAVLVGVFASRANRLERRSVSTAGTATRLAAAAAGALLVLAVAVVGLLDSLLVMPLLNAPPGVTLREAYALTESGETAGGIVLLSIWAGIGAVLAVALLVLPLIPRTRREFGPRQLGVLGVGLAAIGGLGLVVAQWPLGFVFADIWSGGMTATTAAIWAGSVAALVGSILLSVPAGRATPGTGLDEMRLRRG